MKKTAILILIALPFSCMAQVYLGLKSAATFSNYKTKTPWNEVASTGFSAGITAFSQANANLGFNIGLEYIQKGYYHKICNTITDELKANYLEVPVMVDYSFLLPFKNFKGHVNAGFYTAYWISGKYKTQGFDENSEKFDFDKSNASRFDFGPNGGMRFEYLLQNSSISLDIRYELGLMDLQKNTTDNTKNTNRTFVFGFSYMKMLNM